MLFSTILLIVLVACNCNHFRGGTISWKPTGNGLEVEFTYKLGWTYGRGAGCTNALSGQYVNRTTFSWTCSTGCATSTTVSRAGYICSSASIQHNWEQGEYTFTYTFPNAGQFTIQYSSCCWISLDFGSGGSSWTIATEVDLRQRSDLKGPNSSPVYTGYPIYSIKYGCKSTIKLQVSDADNDNVGCRWATGTECNSVCSSIPNAALNQNDCTLTFTANHKAGGIYAVAIIIEDKPRSTITVNGVTYTTNDVLSSVPVQFLVETPDIPSRQCSDRPVFVVPTPSGTIDINVRQGSQLIVEFFVHSVGATITSFALAGPPGIHKSAVSSVVGRTDVYRVTVTWTPSMSQIGRHTLCADATDSFGLNTDPHCIQLNVLELKCMSRPCQNNAACTDIADGFYCTCRPGFEGVLCQNDINDCKSSPCKNGGTCSDHVNKYQCACLAGFTGCVCQFDIDECISRPCFNNGTCIDAVNGYNCVCNAGFTGSDCEIDIDECQSTPCMNNATCHDQVNGFICECQPGYTGTFCEIDIDECQSSPCLHSGTCFDLINSFLCGCEKGYGGTRCETDIDECLVRPCLNEGNCTDLIASFICTCQPGFTGEICQTGINPCSSVPCKNDGKCRSHNSTYFTCSCTDGWEGMNCAFRHQNDSSVNSSFMTAPHMHYSDCKCFLGNAEKQLCYKYKTGSSIGFGALGMFLGIFTVIGLYIVTDVCLSKKLPSSDETPKPGEQLENKDGGKSKDDIGHNDADVEEIPIDQKKTEPEKVKQHFHGHRHRKCWACEVKYNNAPPPRFW